MRLGTLIKGLAILVMVLVAGAIALVLTIDPNDHKDQLAKLARDVTGRDLVLGGDIQLQLGLSTRLAVSDVQFANAEWGSRPDMVSVEQFAAEVALLPLIGGKLRINRLILSGADILLETDEQGRGNWELAAPGEAREGAGDGAPGRVPQVGEITIERARIAYRDGRTGETTELELDEVRARASSLDGPVDLMLVGAWNDIDFKVEGVVGSAAALADRRRPYDVKVTVEALNHVVAIEGDIADPLTGNGLNLRLTVDGENLAALRPLAGEGLPDVGPLHVTTVLTGGPEALTLRNLDLRLGNSDLTGGAVLALGGARPKLKAGFGATRLDLTELLPPAAEEAAPSQDGRIFSSEPLVLDALRAIDVKLDLTLTELIVPDLSLKDVVMSLTIESGKLSVSPLGLTLAGSRFAGVVTVDASGDVPAVSLEAKFPELHIGPMLAEFGYRDLLEGSASIDIAVAGRGHSAAEIMASLQGHSRVLMDEGRARTESFDLLVGGLSQVMGTLFAGQSEWTVVNCIASDFTIANGVAASQIMLADTEHVTVIGEGNVTLGEETLRLKISPRAKSATLNVAVPVNVRGTLAEPTFAPDEAAVVRKLGGVLGAMVFPPAAILGLGEMGSADNPCLNLATTATGQIHAAPESENKSPVGAAGDAVKNVIEGVGEGLKRLFGD